MKVRGTAEGAGPMRRTRVVAASVDASMLTTERERGGDMVGELERVNSNGEVTRAPRLLIWRETSVGAAESPRTVLANPSKACHIIRADYLPLSIEEGTTQCGLQTLT